MPDRDEAAGDRPARRLEERAGRARSWAVLIVLGLVVLIGGGRRLLQALRARRVIGRLGEDSVTPDEIAGAAEHGREGLLDLFRLLSAAPEESARLAAGRALARLWAQDQLVAEEEKAVVLRGFEARWRARRRYPRGLATPIPIAVDFGVSFLEDTSGTVGPTDLEWSHSIAGAQRATLEVASPWTAGPGLARFAIDPGDFPGRGPHRLVLRARARPRGLTSSWELDLPHLPFAIEFDPLLEVDALLTAPDEARGEAISRAVRLETGAEDAEAPRFLDLDDEWTLRNPPSIVVETPLPCDLSHAVAIEFEGHEGAVPAGGLVVIGQGATDAARGRLVVPLGPIRARRPAVVGKPGEYRMRAVLSADASLGWADPDVRSAWPGTIATDWVAVAVVRR